MVVQLRPMQHSGLQRRRVCPHQRTFRRGEKRWERRKEGERETVFGDGRTKEGSKGAQVNVKCINTLFPHDLTPEQPSFARPAWPRPRLQENQHSAPVLVFTLLSAKLGRECLLGIIHNAGRV